MLARGRGDQTWTFGSTLTSLSDMTTAEPLFWTPGAIQELAKRFHTDMLSFNDDMARMSGSVNPVMPPEQLQAWRTFRDSWATWYGSTSAATWLWSATVSTIEGFSKQLQQWRDWYKAYFRRAPTGADPITAKGAAVDTSGKQELSFDWQPVVAVGGLALVGLGALLLMRKR